MEFEDYLVDNEISVVLKKLPMKIGGFIFTDGNDDWNLVVINQDRFEALQKESLKHELVHAVKNHLRNDENYNKCEDEVKSILSDIYFNFE